MKITFPALFQTPLQKYTRYLVYGNDVTVFDRAAFFIQHTLSLKKTIKTEAELLNSPQRAPSLFEDCTQKTLILVPKVTDTLLKHIDSLSEDIFVFISDKARAQSKLVTHFAQDPCALAISAYPSPLLMAELNTFAEGLSLSTEFKKDLFKTYQNDYAGLINIIETLKLIGEDAEKYASFILDNSPLPEGANTLLEGILSRDVKKLSTALSELSVTDFIPTVRLLTRSFLTLLELMPFKRSPQMIQWRALSTPPFFKDQPRFEAALVRWDSKDILAFLETLLSLEKATKQGSLTSPQFSQTLLSLVIR